MNEATTKEPIGNGLVVFAIILCTSSVYGMFWGHNETSSITALCSGCMVGFLTMLYIIAPSEEAESKDGAKFSKEEIERFHHLIKQTRGDV